MNGKAFFLIDMKKELNKYSKTITQDPGQPASQAQLYATGLTEQDMEKGQVGIVSTGFEGNPCNCLLYTSDAADD